MKGKMYKLTGTGLFGKFQQKGMGIPPRHLPKSQGKVAIPNATRDSLQTDFADKQLPLVLPELPVKNK